MMTAALRPDLAGPIILAGSPLSYWAGVRGKSPMRYLGGLLGGTWLTGARRRSRPRHFRRRQPHRQFREPCNPANTYWQKAYNVFSQIDSEPERFLDFETWWGSPVLLNAEEMQWIADNLFVGNKTGARAKSPPPTGERDRPAQHHVAHRRVLLLGRRDHAAAAGAGLGARPLRRRRRPRPLRPDDRLLGAPDHRPSRHLRLGQGGDEGAQRVRLVHRHDRYPAARPLRGRDHRGRGGHGAAGPDRGHATCCSLEPRKLDDIRAFGRNDAGGRGRFSTVARVSEINKGLYETFAAPIVRQAVDEEIGRVAARHAPASHALLGALGPEPAGGPPWRAWPRRCAPNRRPVAPTTIRCARWRDHDGEARSATA